MCEWAVAVMEKVTEAFGQEQLAQNAQKCQKSKMWTDLQDGETGLFPRIAFKQGQNICSVRIRQAQIAILPFLIKTTDVLSCKVRGTQDAITFWKSPKDV